MLNNPAAYRNVAKIAPVTDRMVNGSGRWVDIIVADSTTAFNSYGHDSGIPQSYLFYGFQPFGTGFNGIGEGFGNGAGIGHFNSNFTVQYFAVAQQQIQFSDASGARNGERFRLVLGASTSADIVFSNVPATMRTNLREGIATLTGLSVNRIFVDSRASGGGADSTTLYQVYFVGDQIGKAFSTMTRTTPATGTDYAGTATITSITAGNGDTSLVPPSWWTYLEPGRRTTKWRIRLVRGAPTSGSVTLQINGMTNINGQAFGENVVIPFNATGADVQALIEALAMFDPGDVTVTGPAGGPWDIDFLPTGKWNWDFVAEPLFINNTLNNGAVAYFEERSANLGCMQPRWRVAATGSAGTNGHYILGDASSGIGSAPGYVARDVDFHTWYIKGPGTIGGTSPSNVRGQWNGNSEIHRLQLHNASAGTFTLTFGGNTTGALQWDDSAANIQTALLGLASIGAGNCTVTKIATVSSAWYVTFTGTMASTNVAGVFTANVAGITAFNAEIPKTFEASVFEGRGTAVFFPTVGGSDHNLTTDDAAATLPYVVRDTFSLAADATRTFDLIGMPEKVGAAIGTPFGWMFQATDSPSRTSGFMVFPMVYRGGRGLRTYGQVLQNTPTAFLREVFSAVRFMFTKVGQTPCIRVRIFGGVNDQNDTKPCNLTGAYDSNTQLGFKDNLRAIRAFFEAFWASQGWPVTELHYECNVSAMTTNGDANLSPYRTAANDWSDENDRCCACDWSQLVYNFAQAQARFGAGADSAHPSILGFYDYHRVSLGSLLAARGAAIPSTGGTTVLALDASFPQSAVAIPSKVFAATITQDGITPVEMNIPELHGPTWFQLPTHNEPIRFSHVNGISRVSLRSPTGVATSVSVQMGT